MNPYGQNFSLKGSFIYKCNFVDRFLFLLQTILLIKACFYLFSGNSRSLKPLNSIYPLLDFSDISVMFFFKTLFILFLERGREGEKHECVVAPGAPPTGDLAYNPGMCPDWESNQQPFGSQVGINPLSHTSQGLCHVFKNFTYILNLIICFFI